MRCIEMKFVQDDIPHVILSVSEESFALAEKILHSTTFRSE